MNIEEAKKHIRKQKKVENINLDDTKITSVKVRPTQEITTNLGKYKAKYNELILSKILKEKEKTDNFINDVINHRKKVLQHRLEGHLTLIGQQGDLAKLLIPKCLIEHETIINNIVIGRTIDNYIIKTIAKEIKEALSHDGIQIVTIQQQPTIIHGLGNENAICKTTILEVRYL